MTEDKSGKNATARYPYFRESNGNDEIDGKYE